MKIAYGVHGFGRGHAMRALAVLPELTRRHDVRVLAGGDAYRALHDKYDVVPLPTLKYHHNSKGKLSNWLNVKRNTSMVVDLSLRGPTFQMIQELLEQFSPDVVLTDSEAYMHRVAAHMKIPRITFDHFGILVYCKLDLALTDRLIRWGNSFVYRTLFGEPDRAVVSGFFDAPTNREGVHVVGAVIRPEVLRTEPTRGEHLLLYVNRGDHEFTPQIEQAVASLDCPVRVYGVPRTGHKGNMEFKPIDNLAFISDLASCRAVFATAGNQLCGEVLYFGKPMMAMPMACLEQRLNGMQIERMGAGVQVRAGEVTPDLLRSFLGREEEFVRNIGTRRRDGAAEAIEAIEQFARELTGAPQESPPG